MNWSKYQKDIYKHVEKGDGNAAVVAVAGSGKTTTLTEALRRTSGEAFATSFNKKITEALKERLPWNVRVATFHAYCYGQVRKAFPTIRNVDDRKLGRLIRDLNIPMDLRRDVIDVVGKAKNCAMGIDDVDTLVSDTPQDWTDLAERYSLLPNDDYVKDFVSAAHTLFNASLEECGKGIIDYDDMLYMVGSKLWNVPVESYDWIMLDEAQDFNPLQISILSRIVRKDSRLLVVGDPRQSIYLFRGSDEAAFEKLKSKFNCKEMPLSISYRCARRIVQLAQSLVPYIEYAPDAPDGKVGRIDITDLPDELRPEHDVVLCRNNAPLIQMALRLLRNGRGVRVEGRDIAAGLEKLIKRMNAGNDFQLLQKRLDDWYDREMRLAREEQRPDKMANLEDRYQSVLALVMGIPEGPNRTVNGVLSRLEEVFRDRANVLTLSTVHKAKGLEWDRVFLLRPDLIPSRWAKTPAAMQQEDNLLYVAYTRAKSELYLVMDEEQQEREARHYKDENYDWQ